MLQPLIINAPLDESQTQRLLLGLCAALQDLHASGGVHGSLRPALVMCGVDGTVTLAAPDGVREDGYAAFEMYADDPAWPLGTWSDMYALGAIGHALMLGYPPAAAIARQRDPVRRLFGDASMRESPLGQAVAHALEQAPARRTQNVMQFLHDAQWTLERPAVLAERPAAASASVAAQPPAVRTSPAAQDHAASSRRMPVAGILGVAVLFLVAGLFWWNSRGGDDTTPAAGLGASRGPSASALTSPSAPANGLSAPAAGTTGSTAGSTAGPTAGPTARPAAGSPPIPATGDTASERPAVPATGISGDVPEAIPEPPPLPGYGSSAAPSALSSSTQTPTSAAPPARNGTDVGNGTDGGVAPQPGAGAASGTGQASGSGATAALATGAGTNTQATTDAGAATNSGAGADARSGTDGGSASSPAQTVSAGLGQTAGTDEPPAAEPAAVEPLRSVPVSVSVQPWGEVFINGASRGVSPPLKSLTLAPGTYRVTIQNPNAAPYNTRVTVTAGQPARIQHSFR